MAPEQDAERAQPSAAHGRHQDCQHQRAGGEPGLAITDRGEDVLARLWPVHQRTEAELLAGLTGEERDVLRRALRQVQANAARIAGEESTGPPGA